MREGRGDGLADDADWSVGVAAACGPTAAAADVDTITMVMTARRSPHQYSSEFTKADRRRHCQSYSRLQLASPLRALTRHVGSHSVTCHPAELTFPPLPQLQSWCSI